MTPIPVPKSMAAARPWATPKVFAAPNGDLTDDTIRPAEVLVDPDGARTPGGLPGPAMRIYARLDADEVAALADGGYVEITLCQPVLPPFALTVYERHSEDL